MRRLFRPWPLLSAAYLAAMVVLAITLPPKPSVEFTDSDTQYLVVIGFSPDGRRLATASRQPIDIAFWDPYDKGPIRVRDATRRFGSPPFEDMASTWESHQFTMRGGSNAFFWRFWDDRELPRRLAKLGLARPRATDPSEFMTNWTELSPDGRSCFAFLAPDESGVLDMATGRKIVSIPKAESIRHWSFSGDSATFRMLDNEIGGPDRFRSWDVATGRLIRAVEWPRHSVEDLVVVSPDGRWLVDWELGDNDTRRWRVRDLTTGRIASNIESALGREGLFDNAGRTFAAITELRKSGHPALHLVDPPTGVERIVELDLPTAISSIDVAAFAPDGATLVVATVPPPNATVATPTFWDKALALVGLHRPEYVGEALLVDVASGKIRARLPGPNIDGILRRISAMNRNIAFSDDGRRLAIATMSSDGTFSNVRVWDLPIGRPWGFAAMVAAVPTFAIGVMIGTWKFIRRRAALRQPAGEAP